MDGAARTFCWLLCALLFAPRAGDPMRFARAEDGTLATAPTAPTAPPARATPVAWAFRNARWFDGLRFVAGDRFAVDGYFVATEPAHLDRTLDLNGAYVVPPFGEAHNHNLDNPADADRTIAAYLHDGIFYMKNPTDVAEQVALLRDKINRRDSVDAVYAHAGITATDGHPARIFDFVARRADSPYPGGYKDHAYVCVDSEQDLARVWPRLMRDHPDFIKIFLVYTESFAKRRDDPGYRGAKGLDPALVPVVVARAHQAGLRVTAHIETAADFRVAVQGGVDELAHLPGYTLGMYGLERFQLTAEDARLAASRGVTVVTTTGIAQNDPGNRLQLIRENQVANLRLLHDAGVHLAVGSDDYVHTALAEARNLADLHAFDNVTLLRIWTEDTAQAIFPGRRIGRLEPGYEASFLALAADPIENFEAVTQIRVRVKQGLLLPPF